MWLAKRSTCDGQILLCMDAANHPSRFKCSKLHITIISCRNVLYYALMDIRSLIAEVTRRRRALALTQDELSRRSGVSRRTIIAMEAGQTDIGISRLARLLDAMDLALAVVPRTSRPTESQLRDIFKDDDE